MTTTPDDNGARPAAPVHARRVRRDAILTVVCDYCGSRHEAEPSHVSATQGQIFAVVCDGLTDYYTAERVTGGVK